MKNPLSFAVFLSLIVVFFAGNARAEQMFAGNLSGRQIVPANNSTSSGTCTLALAPTETSATMNCTFNLASPAVDLSFFNNTPVGQNGTPAFTIAMGGGQTGGFQLGMQGITPQNLINLRANRWCIRITTNAFPDGDVRAQFKVANGTYNDYDADGRADLVVYRSSDRTFYARQSLDDSLYARPVGQPGDSVSLNVDFDGDAKSDFSTARLSSQITWRILNSSTDTLAETQWGNSTLGDFFAAADYDGDGRSDIAVFRAGTWYIIESSTGTVRYGYFGQGGDVPTPNDYDKDGKADLAVARSESGQRMWYRLNSSNGQFSGVQFGLSSDAFFAGRADFDGDGAADISVIRNIGGQRNFYILRSSDAQFQAFQWGLSSDGVKLADYDGDGRTDLAVTRAENGGKTWYILQSSDGAVRYDYWGLAGDF
jgi:hypothetical protein